MHVTYFRAERPGPEAKIERTVVASATALLRRDATHKWIAGSLPVGAGAPDILVVGARKEVAHLRTSTRVGADILGYLSCVRRTSLTTLANRLQIRFAEASAEIDTLTEAGVIDSTNGVIRLDRSWRSVLPEVVSVEAKVSNWRKAFQQACRNRIFTHRSYVALPMSVALRTSAFPQWDAMGIGLIGVDDERIQILLEAQLTKPLVWSYYYRVAYNMAKSIDSHAIHSPATGRAN